MSSKVVIKKCDDYDSNLIKKKILESINDLGGIARFIQKGKKVLLKPNILTNSASEKAVTTHPEIVRAIAEIALEAGGIVTIGDSPALMDLKKCAERCGILKVAEDLKIPLSPFDETIPVELPSQLEYKKIEIARPIKDADIVINLPKVKTHSFMFLTLAIKNCFGIIKGIRKSRYHIETGKDPMQFAKFLIACWQAMNPALTIVDGIYGMEGAGPQNGRPRKLGFLVTGIDCVAIDRAICELLRVEPQKMLVLRAAKELGFGETELSNIEFSGDPIESFNIEDFKTPHRAPILPKILIKFFRDSLTEIPTINHKNCKKCGDCIRICPARAISLRTSGKEIIFIDTKKCIRCFCCHEICPNDAVFLKKGTLLKIVEQFFPT